MNFYITGRRAEQYKSRTGEIKVREVKVGFWKDRSRYTVAVVRELRKQRGCGRPPKVL